MDDRQRLVLLTKHYNHLQGSRLAGFYLLLMALPWMRGSVESLLIWLGLWTALGSVWYWLVNRYYKQHYGRIKENPNLDNKRFATGFERLAESWPSSAPLLFLLSFDFRGQSIPPNAWLLFGPFFLLGEAVYRSGLRSRRLYYVTAGFLCLLVLMPALIAGVPGHRFFETYSVTFIGAAFLTINIFDHLLLVRTFTRHPSEFNA
jgi:hypothetical protein